MSNQDRLAALEDDANLWRQGLLEQEFYPDTESMSAEELSAYYLSVAEANEINLVEDNMTGNQ